MKATEVITMGRSRSRQASSASIRPAMKLEITDRSRYDPLPRQLAVEQILLTMVPREFFKLSSPMWRADKTSIA
jgi:hypothetical protein